MFEKSSLGAYCNSYMTNGKDIVSFHSVAELEQTRRQKF